ncbi:hypothetical protein D3C77_679590 [compost metagenome]
MGGERLDGFGQFGELSVILDGLVLALTEDLHHTGEQADSLVIRINKLLEFENYLFRSGEQVVLVLLAAGQRSVFGAEL